MVDMVGTKIFAKSAKPSAFEAEGSEVFKPAVFHRDTQKDRLSIPAKSAKNRRGRKMYQKNTPLISDLKFFLL